VIVGFCVLKLRLGTVQAEAAQAVGLPPIVTSSRQRSASPDPRDGRDKSSGSGGSGGGRARGLRAARSNLSGGSGDEWWRRCFLLPGKTCCRAVLQLRLELAQVAPSYVPVGSQRLFTSNSQAAGYSLRYFPPLIHL